MKKLTLLFSLVFAWALLPSLQAQQAQDSRVMIQGFNWESSKVTTDAWYNIVASKAGDLNASNIDMIWMPPPSDAASIEGYLPRKLYDLNSNYGSQIQLQNCINALHANGVEAIADIVINHRVGVTDWADFQQPAWGCWGVVANDEWGANGGNPCGNWDTGDNYSAARDVDHTNPTVQGDLTAWMNWLKNDIGFDGWRYDYVRGFNGQYAGIYNNGTSPTFSVGELWDNLDLNNPDPHRQQIINWVNQTGGNSAAFDFTTKGILQQAVNGELWRLNSGGQAPGVIGWWPAKAVTFLDNHDTGSTQAHWPFPGDKIMQGYAYILTHPGVPTVFWDHFYDWGLHDEIKALINIRKSNGLHSESQLDIQVAEWNRYGAIIDNKVAMKIGSGDWSPSGSGWNLAASGNGYAVWTKGTVLPPPPPEFITVHFKPNGYTNPTVYFWQDNNGNPTSSTTWPGEAMTAEADGWYSYQVPSVNNCSSLIFSNSGASATADLSRCNDGWYDGSTGVWTNTKPGPIEVGEGFTVHFKPSGYSNPEIYFWATGDGSSTTWPGETMTAEADGWYAYTFPTADCANIIFSNNGASQTADLNRCGDGWYDGTNWSNTKPGGNNNGGDMTVYFKPSGYSNPEIYFWAADNGATTTWPGETMTDEGNGWYSYTFVGGGCSNIIFSNNGASQTADLNRCSTGWYTNGSWSDSQPNARYGRSLTAQNIEAYEVGNYPNPFSEQTTITFNQLEKGHVSLRVFDLLGKEVATLIDDELSAGNHEAVFQRQGQQSGVYIYRLKIGDNVITKRMVLK